MAEPKFVVGERRDFERYVKPNEDFVFPRSLSEHNIGGKHLVIAPERANWLVLDKDEYVVFRQFMSGKNIQQVVVELRRRGMSSARAMMVTSKVVAQILGKEFERAAELTEKEALRTATLFLTAGCNLRCSICVFSAVSARSDECSFADWMRFLKAFTNIGGETVTLTGGEPMTSPNFAKVVTCAKELGLRVVVLTNATLITRENAKLLGTKCAEVQVSIDGPDAETHDSIRGAGAFKRAVAGLKLLSIYHHCRLSISMTPTPATLPIFRTQLRRFIKWVHRNIREDISIRVARRLGKGRKLPLLSPKDQVAYKKAVVALCDDQLEKGFFDKLDALAIVPNRRTVGCGVGDVLTVKSNGDIRLCELFPRALGNIRNIGKGGGYLHKIVAKIRIISRAFRVEELPACRECDLRYFCGGKCRRDNKRDNGDPKLCACNVAYKAFWYERLVRISPYLAQPLT